MDLPLFIAILALLAWTLLPQLDRYTDAETGAEPIVLEPGGKIVL